MEFTELQAGIDDMYMVINNQGLNGDFISCLKWEHLSEFLEEIHMLRKMSVIKVEVDSRRAYNDLLIAYLQKQDKNSVRDHFDFVEQKAITGEDYDNDCNLTDAIINVMADGYNTDMANSEILLTDNLVLTEDVKYLMSNYGFTLKIEK